MIDSQVKEEAETFPKYKIQPGVTIKFQKYTTVKEVFEEATNLKIQEQFPTHIQTDFSNYVFIFRLKFHQRQWNIRKTFAELCIFQHNLSKKYRNIPKIPIDRDEEDKLQAKELSAFSQFLRCFIRTVCQNALKDTLVINFFNIFPERLGHSIIFGEFQMRKRSGGRYNQTSYLKQFYHCLLPCSKSWRLRYFTVTDTGVFYSKRSKAFDIKDILLYCFRFSVICGIYKTGRQLGIVIQSDTRKLKVQSDNLQSLVIFIASVQQAFFSSPFSPNKRQINQKYGSFAPIRNNCGSKFYIDGRDYFEDVYKQLKKAKKYVYITSWMITPYFMLKRPNQILKLEYRLDGVLEQLANKNVKIYIILYKEPKIAINNDSEFVEKYFEAIGKKNIKVLRHPNYILIPFLWSHHQKIIVIDQQVAFLGGLDICYGRWDIPEHPLYNNEKQPYWQGADFCNLRIRDVYKPRDFMMSNLTQKEPKMPWHDVAIQIRGSSVQDVARHFISYWNFVNFQIRIDNDRQLLNLAGLKHNKTSKWAAAMNFFKMLNHKKKVGKDEPMIEMTVDMTTRFSREDDLKKQETKKQLKVPQSVGRRKQSIEQQFYQKYFQVEQNKFSNIKQKILKYPNKIIQIFTQNSVQQEILYMNNEDKLLQHGEHRHLLLRSSSTWSGGLEQIQSSIHTAYLDLIKNAKSFIYIENQFFIAKQNLIVQQLAQRILLAYRGKQNFKVAVFIPLLPGFEGDVRENNSTVMRIQLHLEYETICRSQNSLFKKLIRGKMPSSQIENYIHFFSLRQHAVIANQPVTEILYIHSKLMIVDDRKMILGSANINDRSMLGDRDSEIAIIVQDQASTQVTENNNYWSKEIRNFRCNLFMQHFDIPRAEAQQFYKDEVWKGLSYIAKRNTQIYRYVFGCYPDDKMKKLNDITLFQQKTAQGKIKRYLEEKASIRGHVVDLPLHFLEQENLKIQLSQKEIILPDFFFT